MNWKIDLFIVIKFAIAKRSEASKKNKFHTANLVDEATNERVAIEGVITLQMMKTGSG